MELEAVPNYGAALFTTFAENRQRFMFLVSLYIFDLELININFWKL